MNSVKSKTYRDLPFCEGAPLGDFYTYYKLENLADMRDMCCEQVLKCRTIGILQSPGGKFCLTRIDAPNDLSEPLVQVSLVYLKTPPKSTVMPYPVQIFGTLLWKKRPVIFARIIQELTPAMAISMTKTLNDISSLHMANKELNGPS